MQLRVSLFRVADKLSLQHGVESRIVAFHSLEPRGPSALALEVGVQ